LLGKNPEGTQAVSHHEKGELMPKVPMYTLAWSPVREAYELYDTRDRGVLRIVLDSPAWFAWLEQVSSFAFLGKSGHYTARKEAKQRGDRYWYAYLSAGEQLTKKYLGKSAGLSLERLEYIAGVLRAQNGMHMPAPFSKATASSDGEMDAAPLPLPAQRDASLHPVLATKLFVPRPSSHLVPRVHLVKRLQQGMEHALTLVSGPAGFGKTTLLAQGVAESGLAVAWLSLEAEDNDPTPFLSYLIAALQTLDAQLGTTALALLRTPQPAPPETVLTMLTNELVERSESDIVLVLDDYHVITDESIQRSCTSSWRPVPTLPSPWHACGHWDSSLRYGRPTYALILRRSARFCRW
jgi:LuxR family maltose regulon positive regulatory protein